MTLPKHPAPLALTVPAPIVFGDEPPAPAEQLNAGDADESMLEATLSSFDDGEVTATQEWPSGWAELADRRRRSLSGEAQG